MQQSRLFRKSVIYLRICIVFFLLSILSLFLFSFTVHQLADDFLKQLGITQPLANQKISSTFLEGSFDTYGIKKTKAIPAAVRSAVAKEAFAYAKKQTGSPAFIKQYNELKESKKPNLLTLQTPEQMQEENIARHRKGVQDFENLVKKSDPSLKPAFEKALADARKQLKDAENPNNKTLVNYRKRYPVALQENKVMNDRMLAEWEQEYPANHLLFVKRRLEQFLKETENIDFTATTIQKNGKQIFTNPGYERKSNQWKMAFRAGKDVVEASRIFVQEWINEIR